MTAPEGTTTPPAGGQQEQQWTPPASQADFDRIIGDRLTREKAKYADYDEVKAKAAELDQAKDAQKSELEREREARTAAERERDDLKSEKELSKLRKEISDAAGIPVSALRGSTKEELEAHADELKALLTPGAPSFDGGTRTSATAGGDMNDLIRGALRR